MTEIRKKAIPVLTVFTGAFVWTSRYYAFISLCFALSVVIILGLWVLFPKALRPVSFLFEKLVFALSYAVTFILIAVIHFAVFPVFKIYLKSDKSRFYLKIDRRGKTYYLNRNDNWKNNMKEPF